MLSVWSYWELFAEGDIHLLCAWIASPESPSSWHFTSVDVLPHSVQLARGKDSVTVGAQSRLTTVQPHDLADGLIHVARVVYYPFINYDLVPLFTASSVLQQYLIDNGAVSSAILVQGFKKAVCVLPLRISGKWCLAVISGTGILINWSLSFLWISCLCEIVLAVPCGSDVIQRAVLATHLISEKVC